MPTSKPMTDLKDGENKMLFKIPTIEWEHSQNSCQSTNTFNQYTIQILPDICLCYYGNGRYKEFKNLHDAKEWVEQTHYPAQVAKYFKLISKDTVKNLIDEVIDTVIDDSTHDNCVSLKIDKLLGELF